MQVIVRWMTLVARSVFAFLCLAWLGISLTDIYACSRLVRATEGEFIGSIYSGVICCVTSCIGLASLVQGPYQKNAFIVFLMANTASFIISIVGTALTSQAIILVNELGACSFYSGNSLSCDSTMQNLACVGDSSDFYFSGLCAVNKEDVSPNDSGNYIFSQSASNYCYCSLSSEGSGCATFKGVNNCHDLFHSVPELLQTCFHFTYPLLVISAVLFCFRDPHSLMKDAEDSSAPIPVVNANGVRISRTQLSERRDRLVDDCSSSNSTTEGTTSSERDNESGLVLVVAANTRLPAGFVKTTAEWSPRKSSSPGRQCVEGVATILDYGNLSTTDAGLQSEERLGGLLADEDVEHVVMINDVTVEEGDNSQPSPASHGESKESDPVARAHNSWQWWGMFRRES